MIFRLATEEDDAQLRQLMRETVVPGHIQISYQREPDFFQAHRECDDAAQVVVPDEQGRVVGVGVRSIRRQFVDGRAESVGYLSGLRLHPSVRGTAALGRAYAYLKTLHDAGETRAYLTTIIEGNAAAASLLTSGRARLPAYRPMGAYLTHVCPVRRNARLPVTAGMSIHRAEDVPLSELAAFLCREGSKRQFFPVHDANGKPGRLLRVIGLENIFVAQRQDKIVGTMALWDQSSCKQHVVAGYSRAFRALLPAVNLLLRLQGCHRLPKIGEALRYASAALICMKDDDQRVCHALLRHMMAIASARGQHHVAVGLHERDPLVPVLKRFRHTLYRSRLYLVHWEKDVPYPLGRGSPVPYLEVGTL